MHTRLLQTIVEAVSTLGGDHQVKRRVVKRAFYSSEEDESTEEEVEQRDPSITPEVSRSGRTIDIFASRIIAPAGASFCTVIRT